MPVKGRAETPGQKRSVIETLYSVWCAMPELRLGQLLENAKGHPDGDLFYVEDHDLAQLLLIFERTHRKTITGKQSKQDMCSACQESDDCGPANNHDGTCTCKCHGV